jgi:maltose O-acetyltransferase
MDLLGKVGPGAWIEPPFYCDYGTQIELDEDVFINFGCVLLDPAPIRIGAQTQLGPYVQLYTADHPREAAARVAGPELGKPITIGKRVWIGGGAIVLPGVTIGDDTTIGAGSVVSHDIPSGVVAAGNPCKVIRTL